MYKKRPYIEEYKVWKDHLIASCILPLTQDWPSDKKNLILDIFATSEHLSFNIGKAFVFEHLWPNGERKVVELDEDMNIVSNEEEFWLVRYPFLQKVGTRYQLLRELRESLCCQSDSDPMPSYLLTHNNHFGHFVGDDLARLLLIPLETLTDNMRYYPLKLEKSIDREICALKHFQRTTGLKNNIGKRPTSGSRLEYSENHISVNIYNSAYKAFLTRRLFRNSIALSPNNSRSGRSSKSIFFAYRGGNYKSRISNLKGITLFTSDLDCTFLDISRLSLRQVADTFQEAKLIIAESGSTSLISSLCAPDGASLISLQPQTLQFNPSPEMIFSGIPYSFYYHPNVSPLWGEVHEADSIQTSSLCKYSEQTIRNIILSQQ